MDKTQNINNELTLHIDGTPSNGGDIDLSVFVNKLDNLRMALQETDKYLLGMNKNSVDFFVTDLSHDSPCAITLGSKPTNNLFEHQSSIFSSFTKLIADITSGNYVPASANYQTLKKLSELASGLGDKFSSMWFSSNEKTVAVINTETLSILNSLLSKQYRAYGSVKGRIMGYNSASKEKYFYIYPIVGGRVKCIFDESIRENASKMVENNVTVSGTVSYLEGEFFPSEIKVHLIEKHDPDIELASLTSLVGIEKDITENKPSEIFIKEVRNGWN